MPRASARRVEPVVPASPFQTARPANTASTGNLLGFVLVAGVLYFAREVILPLAFAVLIAFALSPLVNRFRRLGLPRLPAVLTVVTVTFVAIAAFLLVIGHEVALFARDLPTYQTNISEKITNLRDASAGSGIVKRLTSIADSFNQAVASQTSGAGHSAAATGAEPPAAESAPLPVRIVDKSSPLTAMIGFLGVLVSPLASAALVVVVVVFVLLEREHVRDKFVRLIGTSDLHRTTLLLEEAAERVGHYLLMQLLVNTIYAVPIATGLWLLGIPNALLWGMVALVFRFVPYVGPVISAVIPVLLAVAVTPGWGVVVWTLALFIAVEVITGNVVEPLLYGSRTGLTPLAIIVAAIFWTWIWGPLGLVLSTPLTVCLVVIGRHIPQFEVFNILLGDEPALPGHVRLYQRLLVGDVFEATGQSIEGTENNYLSDYHAEVTIPALVLADADRARGVLTRSQQDQLCESMDAMLDQLEIVVEAELEDAAAGLKAEPETAEAAKAEDGGKGERDEDAQLLPGRRLLLIGGRSQLDDASARVLLQAARAEGATGLQLDRRDFLARLEAWSEPGEVDCVAAVFLGSSANRTSVLYLRRLKGLFPRTPVGIVLWSGLEEPQAAQRDLRDALEATGADFVVHTMPEFFEAVQNPAAPRPLQQALPQRRPRQTVATLPRIRREA